MLNLKGRDLGRYHLIEPLGVGGMAMVYKAYDATLDRNVAVKVIRTEMGSDPSFLQRFQREAKALAKLDHPYILKVLDYGEQDGMPYLVMPFVSGGTLKEKMGQPTPTGETARTLAPIARALAYAHQQGIIHRDVKPANILITPTGAPALSDFGIAKLLETDGSQQLTATGVGMGTPDYMAPEQWLGTVDARTDVYALGVILFQMITGRLPYTADTPAAVLLKHMQDPLPRPGDFVPGLADAVERVIFKALAKDPADRFQTMDAFADALERLAQGAAQPAEVAAAVAPAAGVPAPRVTPPAQRQPTPPAGTPAGGYAATTAAASSAAAAPAAAAPAAPARRGMPWLALGGGAVLVLGVVLCIAAAAVFLVIRANRQRALLAPTSTPVAQAQPGETLPASTATGIPPLPAQPSATVVQAAEATPTIAATAEPTIEPTATRLAPITKIEGLPEDIPVYADNNGDLMTQTSNDVNMFMYTTAADTKTVSDFFKEEMLKQGWKIQNTTTIEAQDSVMYTFLKDTRMAMINVAKSDDQTMVLVQLMKSPY